MDIDVGTISSYQLTEEIKKAIESHVKEIDNQLVEEYNENKFSSRFKTLARKRLFSYEEFVQKAGVEKGFITFQANEKDYIRFLLAHSGKVFFSPIRAHIPYSSLKEHAHIVGKTRSGKSEFLRLLFYSLQDMSQENKRMSLVLIDPQGDLAKKVKSSHLNNDHDRLIYIAPNLKKGYVPVFNPMELEKDSELLLEKTTEFLVEAFDEMLNDQTLSDQMRTVLTPCIYTLLKRGDSSLEELQRFMLNDPGLIALGKQSDIKPHRDFFRTKFLQYKAGKERDQFARTKTAVYSRIQNLLNSPKFYHMTMGKSTVNLAETFNSGKVVIFDLSGLGGITKDAFGRFIIAKIKAIAENREIIPEEYRKPTFVFIDECQYFITRSIERTLSEMGKYGLHLILAHQYIRQLGNMAESLLSNTDLKVVFKNHESTLQKFASYLGMKVESMRKDWKKYECYIKTGERATVKIKPSDKLIKKKKYTLSEEQEKRVNHAMIKQYYKKITKTQEPKESPLEKENSNNPIYDLYLGK